LKKTTGLLIVCVVSSLFFWSLDYWYDDSELLVGLMVFSGHSFFRGRFWTVFTALFIHADPTHLVGNTIFLYVFGSTLEDEVGVGKTLTAFFAGGILSFLLSAFLYGLNTVMFGASAAIFSLTAIVMLTKPLKFSWAFLMPLGLVALLYFVYNVIAVLSTGNTGDVGYWGHIVGFVTGFPFGIAWSPRKWVRNLSIAIVLLVAYLIIMSLVSFLLEGSLPFF
jgi:membrane associated rhomboid family serine protease